MPASKAQAVSPESVDLLSFPCSYAQERLWFIDQREPGSGLYNIPLRLRLKGELDKDVLEGSMQAVIARHEILRTTFQYRNDNPVQIVHEQIQWNLDYKDFSTHPEDQQRQELLKEMIDQMQVGFDLAQGPLLRALLLKLKEREHVLLITLHHIVSDEWSIRVMVRELVQLYESSIRQAPPSLPSLPIQYADYAVWQREWLQSGVLEEQLGYWEKQLASLERLELCTDYPRSAVIDYMGSEHVFSIPQDVVGKLKELSRKEGITMYITFLAAFQVLLARYGGQPDIAVGTPVTGRHHKEIENLIGFFLNTVVMRLDLSGNPSLREILRRAGAMASAAFDCQDAPFEKVVNRLHPTRTLSHNPLFSVMFDLQNLPRSSGRSASLSIEAVPNEARYVKFDLSLTIHEKVNRTEGALRFQRHLYEIKTIQRLVDSYQRILAQMSAHPEICIADIAVLSESDRRQLLLDWNQTKSDYPKDKCIQQLFEEQAERTPDATAVSNGLQKLAYRELNQQANQLGHYLRAMGVGPETRVGVCLERNLEMVIALLGILKAGGGYVPLEPEYPAERLCYIAENAEILVLVTQQELRAQVVSFQGRTIILDTQWPEIAGHAAANLVPLGNVSNLAYVLYTSGSTGQPKGVCIEQRQLLNYVYAIIERMGSPSCDFAMVQPLAVDSSVTALFPPLLQGSCLYLIKREWALNPTRMQEFFQTHRVGGLKIAPSHLAALHAAGAIIMPRDVLVIGGESSQWSWMKELQELAPDCLVFNHYGPTETTVGILAYRLGENDAGKVYGISPLGRPLGNTRAYVLDQRMELVPPGMAEEIYIGGENVARGYLHQPALTAEKFVPDEFAGEPGSRLYRTGDRGRWLSNGYIEFLGRFDDQVKLRGYRIELGEIEVALRGHESVAHAAVLLRDNKAGQKRLVGYVAGKPGTALEKKGLREHLQRRLPDYMVPNDLVVLEEWPRTAHGKLDRSALPLPPESTDESEEYVAPRNAIEEALCRIWAKVLGRENIGIRDNFFEAGGDSILTIQVVARAREAGVEITPRQMFEHQTIAELAEKAGRKNKVQAEQGITVGQVPLLPIQSAFFQWKLSQPQHYNQSVMLVLNPETNSRCLENAIEQLLTHHDALRMRYEPWQSGSWKQWCEPEAAGLVYERRDPGHWSGEEWMSELERDANHVQASLNLEAGRLMRAVEYDLGGNRGRRLLLVIHHLVVDGVSWRILLEDLERCYRQLQRGMQPNLGPKTTSYKEWAERLRRYAAGEDVKSQLGYWVKAAQVAQSCTALPRDYEHRGELENITATQSSVVVRLPESETQELLQQVPVTYHTQVNDVLLTALWRVYSEWSGNTRLLIDLEGHGREEIFDDVDLSRTVGWFTTVYPVILGEEHRGHYPGQMLKCIKEQLRKVPQRGIGYGVLRYLHEDEKLASELAQGLRPEIAFNYLGQVDQVLSESNLFQPARESHGKGHGSMNRRRYVLDVNGVVSQGCMQLTWSYSGSLHRRETIVRLAERYLECLREIIAHCRQDKVGGYTPSDFPWAQLEQGELDRFVGQGRDIEDIYALSPMQHGLLFHFLCEPESVAYFNQLSCRLESLHPSAFRSAWEEVLRRHAALRTALLWDGVKNAVQIVHRAVELPWKEEDWRVLSPTDQAEKWSRFLQDDREQGFDLQKAPLMRMALVRTGEETYNFLWSNHHILIDGWCRQLVIGEVLYLYDSYCGGKKPQLEPRAPFRDYIKWLQQQDEAKAEQFWREELRGFSEPTRLWIDKGSGGGTLLKPEQKRLRLSKELTHKVEQLARRLQVTVNTVLQGAWGLLLGRYSDQSDLVFGATVSGRPPMVHGIESMVGLFMNTLPVRVKIHNDQPAGDYLRELQERQSEARQYEYTPLVKIQVCAETPRSAPLFEYLLTVENYPIDTIAHEKQAAQLRIHEVQHFETTHYPLSLAIGTGKDLTLLCGFQSNRFEPPYVEQFLAHFENLLQSMATCHESRLGALPILTDAERRQLLLEWSRVDVDYRAKKCVHELFEEQVIRTPEAVAIEFDGMQWSYAELNRQANRLARYLRKLGVGPEARAALYLERSPEMVVAILGVLKAGGAYVPLAIAHSPDRIAYILKDTETKVLLTREQLEDRLPPFTGQIVRLDSDAQQIKMQDDADLTALAGGKNLAYVIFTSGSTGNPKGVAISHQALTNHMAWMAEEFRYGPRDRILQKTAAIFDASVWEFYAPLLSGGQLVLLHPDAEHDARSMGEQIAADGITVVQMVPTLLQAVLASGGLKDKPKELRLILCGGEALRCDLVRPIWEEWGTEVVNLYGPTEATIDASYWRGNGYDSENVPIGKPIANMQLYVLDEEREPVPVGVAGELYLGGAGLARGYLNQPRLTAERFVPNPFVRDEEQKEEARLYRSGDWVRWKADGNLEFLGRIDQQVKLHGHRIELGEIEFVLAGHPQVHAAAVVVLEDLSGHKRLAGYVVGKAGVQVPDSSELRAYLQKRLPDYMVPGLYTEIPALPLTASGKLDRKRLPRPEIVSDQKPDGAPRNEVEERLCGIWAGALGLERVGIHDNFFEVGGDSILCIQIVSRAREAGIELSPKLIFEKPTIAELACCPGKQKRIEAVQGTVVGRVPITAIQLLFLQQGLSAPHHFNQSVLLELNEHVDSRLLEIAILELLVQHDALRMKFERNAQGEWEQWCPAETPAGVYRRRDLSLGNSREQKEALERDAALVQGSLDLHRGELFRAIEYTLGAGRKGRLLLVVHHLVIDGFSWRILLEDLERAYEQTSRGRAVWLGSKTTSYKQWAQSLLDYAQLDQVKEQAEFWISRGSRHVSALPKNKTEEENLAGTQKSVVVWLGEDQTRQLLQAVPEAYHTQINDILLAALWRVLSTWMQSGLVRVDVEGHGREDLLESVDLSRTVGWFTAIYPVLLGEKRPVQDDRWDIGRALKLIKEQLREVFARGFEYGALKYLCTDEGIRKRLLATQKSEVLFNYLGQFDQVFRETKIFDRAFESRGRENGPQNRRQYLLEINATVTRGRLRISWNYNEKLHDRETIQLAADRYTECLTEIIEHCCKKQAGGHTPSDFPLARLSQTELDLLLDRMGDVADLYALSPMQQGLLFHALLEPESEAYFNQLSCRMEGLDAAAFRTAWEQLIERHAMLRTCFFWEGLTEPVQVVHRKVQSSFQEEDWRSLTAEEQHARWLTFLQNESNRRIDFTRAPLLRLVLMQIGERDYYFCWSTHHSLMDGWSAQIITSELFSIYDACRNGRKPQLKSPRVYRDYIAWLQEQDEKSAEVFWRDELRGYNEPARFWNDRQESNHAGTIDFHRRKVSLGIPLTTQVVQTARQNQVTVSTVIAGAWAFLLSRCSGKTDVVFGSTTSGRGANVDGIEAMVGLFINTLPVRVRVHDGQTVNSYLKLFQQKQAESRQYEYSPLVKVQGWSDVPSGAPLFEYVLVFENYPIDAGLRNPATRSINVSRIQNRDFAHYPLLIEVQQGKDLSLSCKYATGRLSDEQAEWLLEHLKRVIGQVTTVGLGDLGDIALLSQAEEQQLLIECNGTVADFPRKGFYELFEEQVARAPKAIAVVHEGCRLTYEELSLRALRMAHALRKKGVAAGDIVPILAPRNADFLSAILAVFASGAAYLPLDPESPPPRLRQILHESRARLMLVCQALIDQAGLHKSVFEPERNVEIQGLETLSSQEEASFHWRDCNGASDLAYVIYTSGSTGLPKGAMVTHEGMINHLFAKIRGLQLTASDVIAQTASHCFDISVWQFLAALLVGGKVVIVGEEQTHEARALIEALTTNGVTVFESIPSMLQILLEERCNSGEQLSKLRWVLVTGEACPVTLCRKWMDQHPWMGMMNAYGPTECSDDVTHYALAGSPPEAMRSLPIGRPIANARIYILGPDMRLVPPGVLGEIYVGGVCVGGGYVNRPEVTAERFVPDPFSPQPGERMYGTGDLGHWRDGNLEFHGRVDYQVKLRGYRIELGEIEMALSEHSAVREVAVVIREDWPGEKRLVGYLTSENGAQIDVDEVRSYLATRMPRYMVPAVIVVLLEMPHTPNGKIDRKALPKISTSTMTGSEADARNEIEEILLGIWTEVLGVTAGIHDNFFDLGGDSLQSMRVISKVRSILKLELPLRVLFDKPTIAGMAESVIQAQKESQLIEQPPIVVVDRRNELPLSYAQQRLWFIDQMDPGNNLYNITLQLHLRGLLNVVVLERSLQEIVCRHEVLRTRFAYHSDHPVQIIMESAETGWSFADLTGASPEQKNECVSREARCEMEKGFNLAHGPLLRCRLLRLKEQEHVLLVTMHHIVSDGWSMNIMTRELAQIYEAFLAGEAAPMAILPVQYADFAVWQRQWLQGQALEKQLGYWRHRLGGMEALELATDRAKTGALSNAGAYVRFVFPSELSKNLKKVSRREATTLFMTLLAGFQVLLSRYSRQNEIAVGTPITGRRAAELDLLIGFFVNMLVMKADLASDPMVRDLLRRVRETALDAYANQDVSFANVVEDLQPERSLNRHPLFDVVFALQNLPQRPVKVQGLEIGRLETDIPVVTKFDLMLTMHESDLTMSGVLLYREELFDRGTIERMVGHYQRVLEEMVEEGEKRVSELRLLSEGERREIVEEWSEEKRGRRYEEGKSIHELIEEQVGRQGRAVAVIFEEEELSYEELNRRANQVAHYLRKRGAGAEVRVGVCVERSLEMVIVLLGVLKAGGAYVPLDPGYPAERLRYMVKDAGIKLLVMGARKREEEEGEAGGGWWQGGEIGEGEEVIDLAEEWKEIEEEEGGNPERVNEAGNLAYVIYTSGSTGQPKGAMISHYNVVRLLQATEEQYRFSSADRWSLFHSYAFDFSVWELWGGLAYGGQVVVVPQGISRSAGEFYQVVKERGITVLNQTPSAFYQFMEEDRVRGERLKLRVVILGGEMLAVGQMGEWMERHGEREPRLVNMYGITETTVHVTMKELGRKEVEEGRSQIGRVVEDLQGYVLDEWMEPVPVGVGGELYVGGAGLGRGYLGRAGLTAERFVPNQYSGEGGERLYRTGDLVRMKEGGELEYLGRIDHQVKIRGFRIELGEIETLLKRHAGVRQAAVIVREDRPGDRKLVAYVVKAAQAATGTALPTDAIGEQTLSAANLRGYLQEYLPEYSVPAAFVEMDELPLTSNGKLDHRQLPIPEMPGDAQSYIGPRDAVEEVLCGAFAEALGLRRRISIHENFFELGGDSFLAVQMVARAIDSGLAFSVKDVFIHQTVAELARLDPSAKPQLQGLGSILVKLWSAGSKPPLFFVHPMGGGIDFLFPLVRRLRPDRPIYGIRSGGLNGEQYHPEFDELITEYIGHIKSVQKDGPFFLGGYSSGGTMAFAIALRLIQKGHSVAFLGQIDSEILPPMVDENTIEIMEVLSFAKMYTEESLSVEELALIPQGERLGYLLNRIRPSTSSFNYAQVFRIAPVWQAHRKVMWDFRARIFAAPEEFRYPGHITLFKTSEQTAVDCAQAQSASARWLNSPTGNWEEFAPRRVDVRMISGRHNTCIQDPHVKDLAIQLSSALQQAE